MGGFETKRKIDYSAESNQSQKVQLTDKNSTLENIRTRRQESTCQFVINFKR